MVVCDFTTCFDLKLYCYFVLSFDKVVNPLFQRMHQLYISCKVLCDLTFCGYGGPTIIYELICGGLSSKPSVHILHFLLKKAGCLKQYLAAISGVKPKHLFIILV